jgi:hypothetical protein
MPFGRPDWPAFSAGLACAIDAASRSLPFRFALRRREFLTSLRISADAPPSGGFPPLSGFITL